MSTRGALYGPENLGEEKRANIGKIIEIPGFGKVTVIPATNTVGCVDPRTSLKFVTLGDEFVKENLNPNVVRARHDESTMRSPCTSVGYVMSLLGANRTYLF